MSTRPNQHTTSRASRLRKPAAVVAALLAAVSIAACGSSNTRETTGIYTGDNGAPAPYLSVGPLLYNVQISRALNPYDTEDSSYLTGLTPAQRELKPGEEFFGVFLRVYNETGKQYADASEITVSDAKGNLYRPIVPTSGYNPYVYRPGTVPQKSLIPLPGSTAFYGPVSGALLLYKIKLESLEYRPLTIKIVSPTKPSETASAELDV